MWSRIASSSGRVPELGRRLVHFFLVWSVLLLVHEAGHAWSARAQGLEVRRVTVGAGPALLHGGVGDTEVVLRLVPLAGITSVRPREGAPAVESGWEAWRREAVTIVAGVLATLSLAAGVAGAVAALERVRGRRWRWGRIVVADALVLTVFNFLPVPPLDGGRALLATLAAWRGAPLGDPALFWVQVGGLAMAVVPMMLWTGWTRWIDRLALGWRTPDREPAGA